MCHILKTYSFNVFEELFLCERFGQGIGQIIQCRDLCDEYVSSFHDVTDQMILPLCVFTSLVAARLFGISYSSTVVTVECYCFIHVWNNFQIT